MTGVRRSGGGGKRKKRDEVAEDDAMRVLITGRLVITAKEEGYDELDGKDQARLAEMAEAMLGDGIEQMIDDTCAALLEIEAEDD